jgi:hypothetical protein
MLVGPQRLRVPPLTNDWIGHTPAGTGTLPSSSTPDLGSYSSGDKLTSYWLCFPLLG